MKNAGVALLALMAWLVWSNTAAAQDSERAHAALHVAGGTAMSAAVGGVMKRPWLGLLSTVVVGMAKESYDYRVRREPGLSAARDAAMISAGAAVGYMLARRTMARQRRAAARLELQQREPAGETPDPPSGTVAAMRPAWTVRR